MALTERLTGLWIEQLKHLHHLEVQLIQGLPAMIQAAERLEVRNFLTRHHARATSHFRMLGTVLADLAESPGTAMPVPFIGEWNPAGDDIELLRKARKAMHQEIARLAKAANGARVLGYEDFADTLTAAMEEEQQEEVILTRLGRMIHGSVQRFIAA